MLDPYMMEMKWRHPENIQSKLVTHLLVPSLGRNGSSKDFILYNCVPTVSRSCSSLLPSRMETASLVEKTEMKLTLKCATQH